MSFSGIVKGHAQMRHAFRAATPELQRQFNEATEDTVAGVLRDARQRVPVDTGTLRDHLDSSFSPKTGFGKVGITTGSVMIARRGADTQVMIATKYAHLVEFGTVSTTARPFMLPAAEGQRVHYAARLRSAGRRAERNLSVSRFA